MLLTGPAPQPTPQPPPRPGVDLPPIEAPDPSGLLDRFMAWDGAWTLIGAVVLAVVGLSIFRRHPILLTAIGMVALTLFAVSVFQ